ncbi:MAG: hypothetical protein JWQ12_1778 [Glaciihabitans sp.]|nr:hypothetical protein [Glaciihabitans sp.]
MGNKLSDDRRLHLEQLQSAIARMAYASSRAKTWLLPVATATYGYALANHDTRVAGLGIAAVCLFAFLDARYLREERAFRALFSRASRGRGRVYDMNSRAFYGKPNDDKKDRREENCRWRKIIWSWSLAGFYLPVAAVGVIVIALTLIP